MHGRSRGPQGAELCKVEGCQRDMSLEKPYYRRYSVCESHLRSLELLVDGQLQRFCQQCGKFQTIADFDDTKRSCRTQLARHSLRRRIKLSQRRQQQQLLKQQQLEAEEGGSPPETQGADAPPATAAAAAAAVTAAAADVDVPEGAAANPEDWRASKRAQQGPAKPAVNDWLEAGRLQFGLAGRGVEATMAEAPGEAAAATDGVAAGSNGVAEAPAAAFKALEGLPEAAAPAASLRAKSNDSGQFCLDLEHGHADASSAPLGGQAARRGLGDAMLSRDLSLVSIARAKGKDAGAAAAAGSASRAAAVGAAQAAQAGLPNSLGGAVAPGRLLPSQLPVPPGGAAPHPERGAAPRSLSDGAVSGLPRPMLQQAADGPSASPFSWVATGQPTQQQQQQQHAAAAGRQTGGSQSDGRLHEASQWGGGPSVTSMLPVPHRCAFSGPVVQSQPAFGYAPPGLPAGAAQRVPTTSLLALRLAQYAAARDEPLASISQSQQLEQELNDMLSDLAAEHEHAEQQQQQCMHAPSGSVSSATTGAAVAGTAAAAVAAGGAGGLLRADSSSLAAAGEGESRHPSRMVSAATAARTSSVDARTGGSPQPRLELQQGTAGDVSGLPLRFMSGSQSASADMEWEHGAGAGGSRACGDDTPHAGASGPAAGLGAGAYGTFTHDGSMPGGGSVGGARRSDDTDGVFRLDAREHAGWADPIIGSQHYYQQQGYPPAMQQQWPSAGGGSPWPAVAPAVDARGATSISLPVDPSGKLQRPAVPLNALAANVYDPTYNTERIMHRLSLKLFNNDPEHLRPQARAQLAAWLAGMNLAMVHMTARHGCLHVVMDVLARAPRPRVEAPPAGAGAGGTGGSAQSVATAGAHASSESDCTDERTRSGERTARAGGSVGVDDDLLSALLLRMWGRGRASMVPHPAAGPSAGSEQIVSLADLLRRVLVAPPLPPLPEGDGDEEPEVHESDGPTERVLVQLDDQAVYLCLCKDAAGMVTRVMGLGAAESSGQTAWAGPAEAALIRVAPAAVVAGSPSSLTLDLRLPPAPRVPQQGPPISSLKLFIRHWPTGQLGLRVPVPDSDAVAAAQPPLPSATAAVSEGAAAAAPTAGAAAAAPGSSAPGHTSDTTDRAAHGAGDRRMASSERVDADSIHAGAAGGRAGPGTAADGGHQGVGWRRAGPAPATPAPAAGAAAAAAGAAGAARLITSFVQLPPLSPAGLVILETQFGEVLGPWRPLVNAPSAGVARELAAVADATGADRIRDFLVDYGRLVSLESASACMEESGYTEDWEAYESLVELRETMPDAAVTAGRVLRKCIEWNLPGCASHMADILLALL